MKITILLLLPLLFSLTPAISAEPEVVFEDAFDREELSKGWSSAFGEWKIVEGVLRARQIPADNHAAATRRALPMGDGIFEMKFRLVEKGQAFHFGFDPAKGELDKRGHLFSVIVSPERVSLKKHVDKARPKEDPNETLLLVDHAFGVGNWQQLRIEKKGNDVAVSITAEGSDASDAIEFTTTHPTFHVNTPALVFRCIGDGIEVDDIRVSKLAE